MNYSFYVCPTCGTRSVDMQLAKPGSPDPPSHLDSPDSVANGLMCIAHERLQCQCGKIWSWHELTKVTTVLRSPTHPGHVAGVYPLEDTP